MASKIKGLQQWCRKMTDGYRDVDVKDFTVSWRNGLAFCAMIHRFRPDLIDYDSLSKENVFDNNNLAFTVAEQELDIPAFLEAADMVALRTPDKLSVITYVSQYYNKLSTLPQLGGPGVQGKTTKPAAAHGTKRHQPAEPLSEPEPKKQPPAKQPGANNNSAKVKTLGDRCAICNNKVYLLERHVEEGKLYHRSCYRHSDLSPTNKIYTQSPFLSPSLHSSVSPTAKSTPVSSLDKDHSHTPNKTENKHGVKRPADDASSEESSKKSDVRKFLFSKDTESNSKSHELSPRSAGLGKSDASKSKQDQSAVGSKSGSNHTNAKVSSNLHTESRTSDTRGSLDFLSAEKDLKNEKSPKRQLPLIFQTSGGGASDDATSKTKNDSKSELSVLSKGSSDGGSKTSGLLGKLIANGSKPGLSEKGDSNSNSSSTYKSKPVPDSVVRDKSKQDVTRTENNLSDKKVSERISVPVAKPRHLGKKVLPDVPETGQDKDKSVPVPKPSPRTSLPSTGHLQSSAPAKAKSPVALRKVSDRPVTPDRDKSPPPLPSSAPPPLPQSTPSASPRALSSLSPQPSPRTHHVSTSKVVVSQDGPSKSTVSVSTSKASSTRPSSLFSSPHSKSISTESNTHSVVTRFGNKPSIGGMPSPRHEEPMEVETAFSKAKAQYGEEPVAVMVVPSTKGEEKSTLTGLLKSLAHVRKTSSSTSTSTTSTSSPITTTQTPGRADKTSVTGLTPSAQSPTSSGFVSSKVTHMNTKESDHKAAAEVIGRNVRKYSQSHIDGQVPEFAEKPSVSVPQHNKVDVSQKASETQSKISPRSMDTSSDKTQPVTKVGETVNSKLNVSKKSVEDSSKPVSDLSKQEQKEQPTGRVHLYKKKAESNARDVNKPSGSPRYKTDTEATKRYVETSGKKERPKSAADILGSKDLSTPKQSAASKDDSQPPPFTQVKLRDSGQTQVKLRDSGQSAGDRTEKAKSAGMVLDNAGSRPSWQQEAERKMAMFRNMGFVDPETKKAVGKPESPVDDDSKEKHDNKEKLDKTNKKEAPPRPAPIAVKTPLKEEKMSQPKSDPKKDEKPSQAKPNLLLKKNDGVKDSSANAFKHDAATSVSEKPASGTPVKLTDSKEEKKPGLNLKSILKGGNKTTPTKENKEESPPPKPERHKVEKQPPEINVTPLVVETPKSQTGEKSAPKNPETTETKKKISVGDFKDLGDSLSVSPSPSARGVPPTRAPPPLPDSEPPEGRKKISVDIDFDFNLSNSLDSTEQPKSPVVEKATPPPRPPPPHRTSMSPGRLSAIELQQQLLDIDTKLSELELRGRHLEDSIRSVAAEEEDEVLMIEWFELVTEKNDLVRKECDLVYMSREQDLEDEQSQIEAQLHYLLFKDENDKSLEEKEEEEYLIERKLRIVDQRNSIVESMDEDRLRYEEEDRDIAIMLHEKGFKKDGSTPPARTTKKGKGAKGDAKRKATSKFYA